MSLLNKTLRTTAIATLVTATIGAGAIQQAEAQGYYDNNGQYHNHDEYRDGIRIGLYIKSDQKKVYVDDEVDLNAWFYGRRGTFKVKPKWVVRGWGAEINNRGEFCADRPGTYKVYAKYYHPKVKSWYVAETTITVERKRKHHDWNRDWNNDWNRDKDRDWNRDRDWKDRDRDWNHRDRVKENKYSIRYSHYVAATNHRFYPWADIRGTVHGKGVARVDLITHDWYGRQRAIARSYVKNGGQFALQARYHRASVRYLTVVMYDKHGRVLNAKHYR